MTEVEEMVKKGLIKGGQQEAEYHQKMMDVYRSKLKDYNNRRLLLSKGFR